MRSARQFGRDFDFLVRLGHVHARYQVDRAPSLEGGEGREAREIACEILEQAIDLSLQ